MYVHLSSTQTEAAHYLINITMKVALCVVTVLLEYLDLALWFPFFGREGRGHVPPVVLILLMDESVITSSSSLYSAVSLPIINSMHKDH